VNLPCLRAFLLPFGAPPRFLACCTEAAEEFESHDLKIEKVIAGGTSGTVRLRPLDPGRYPFVGEYHEDTAKGVIVSE